MMEEGTSSSATIELPTLTKLKTCCGICFEEKNAVEFGLYKNSKTKCSGPPHVFCQDCITQHIVSKIQANNSVVRCPGEACRTTFDPVSCRSLIPVESFVQWTDLLVGTWIAQKGHRQAVCPYEGCAEVVVDECKGGGRQECPKCKRPFCFGCGGIWTSNNNHKECKFDEKVFLNKAKSENWKRCPVCRYFVQRNGGCTVITCRCGARFSYNSGQRLPWFCSEAVIGLLMSIIIVLGLIAAVVVSLVYATKFVVHLLR